jgi:hypothetical protein
MKIKQLLLLSLLWALHIFSCASLTSPSGGPDDKTGPEVLASTPVPKSTNINTDTRISFTFSEWISNKKSDCISIFPPIAYSTKIHSNKLDIYPLEKLQDSTTYHVLITSTLLDLHGNPISPYNLIFSTGPDLDSGSISGCIIDPAEKTAQYRIAFFTPEDLADSGVCGTPSYLLQTDTTGKFNFTNLKTGSYQAIAYVDINNDAHLQATESVFTPEDSLIYIDQITPMVFFYPSVFDTSFPRITSLKAINNKILSAVWSKKYDSLVFNSPTFKIERTNHSETLQNVRYAPLNNSLSFMLCTDIPMEVAPYRVIFSTARSFDNQVFNDTILFNGINTIDTVFPVLKSKPDTTSFINLTPELKLIWSKPVTATTHLFLKNQSGDSIPALLSKGYSDTTIIRPVQRLHPSTVYSITILKKHFRDLYGNTIFSKDSSDTADTVMVKTADADSIALSLQGTAPCLGHSESRVWFYTPFTSPNTRYLAEDSAGYFRFDSITAGKGYVGYFNDKNKNRTPDKGRIYPWHSPEPYITATDTVEARARWDVEGISISICDPCRFSASDSASIDTTDSKGQ